MRKTAIVVPVHNGAADLERCLASLARHRPQNSTLVLVDDASTDRAIVPALHAFQAANPGVEVITSAENRGFIVTSNRGAKAAPEDADLIFLNTDTEVTRGWADEMHSALEAHHAAVVSCPLSNNATILSVPRFQQESALPFDWDADRMGALVRDCAADLRAVPIPTPVGFCMLVKRDAWDRFGPFDEAFGRGYGEEDDFGQRVQAAGHAVVCAPRAFVYHKGAASFGASAELAERRRANGALLLSRWPHYNERTKAWCRSNPLRPLHEKIWQALLARAKPNVNVLHVQDRWELAGPLRARMLDIVDATKDFAMHTVVVPMPDRGAWMDAMDFEYAAGLRVVGLMEFESRFAAFIEACAPTVVHFHGDDWLPSNLIDHARDHWPVLVMPGDAHDPARCAAMYRRAGTGR